MNANTMSADACARLLEAAKAVLAPTQGKLPTEWEAHDLAALARLRSAVADAQQSGGSP